MKIAIITQIKNESKRLKEWVNFHSFFYNIDYFFFYLDHPEDESEATLKELQIKYNIGYKFVDSEPYNENTSWFMKVQRLEAVQKISFSEGFELLRKDYDWIGIFDVDEWIVPNNLSNFDLRKTLSKTKENILYLPMYNFIPPFDYEKSITEQNFYRWSCQERSNNGHKGSGKSIIRGKILIDKKFSLCIHLGPNSPEYRNNVDFESKNHEFKLHHFQNHLYHQDKKYEVFDDSIKKMFNKMELAKKI